MKRIKGFDGLRFFSIMFVLTFHLGALNLVPDIPYIKKNIYYFFSGGAGVSMFFAISGFLITSLLLFEKKTNGKINIKKFFIRRFLRLLPPIIPFYIAVAMFMYMGYIRESYIGLLASILYLYNFIPIDKRFFTAELTHTWSLAVEEQFYFTWPFALSFLNPKRIYSLVIVVLIISFGIIFSLPYVSFHHHLLNHLFYVERWIIPAIAPILIGSVAALFNNYNYKLVKHYFQRKMWLFISLGILCVPFYLPDFLFVSVQIFYSLGASLLLLWISHNQFSGLVVFLENKVMSYIGKISYGLYIWQGFFIGDKPKVDPKLWVHFFPVNIILTFLVAIISFEFYEKKILKIKQRYK